MSEVITLTKEDLAEMQKSIAAEVSENMKSEIEKKAIHGFTKADGKYDLKDLVNAMYTKDVSVLRDIEKKATMNVTTGSQGGYTVPTELNSEVFKIVDDYGIVYSLVRKYNMTTTKMDISTKGTGSTWYKVGENVAGTESNPTFGTKELDATDYIMTIARSSRQLLEDNAVNIQQFLADEFGYGLAQFLDKEILAGDGTNYTGVLNAVGTNLITMDAGDTIANIEAEDLSAMIDALTSGERRNGAFFFNKIVAGKLRILRDANGSFVYQQPDSGDLGRAWGFPVYFVEDDILPVAPGASTKFGVFGNLQNTAFGVREGQSELMVSDVAVVGGESTWERNQLAWKMLMRPAITVTSPGAYSVIRTGA